MRNCHGVPGQSFFSNSEKLWHSSCISSCRPIFNHELVHFGQLRGVCQMRSGGSGSIYQGGEAIAIVGECSSKVPNLFYSIIYCTNSTNRPSFLLLQSVMASIIALALSFLPIGALASQTVDIRAAAISWAAVPTTYGTLIMYARSTSGTLPADGVATRTTTLCCSVQMGMTIIS